MIKVKSVVPEPSSINFRHANKYQMITGIFMMLSATVLFMSDIPRINRCFLDVIPWAVLFTLFFFGLSLVEVNMKAKRGKHSPDLDTSFKKKIEGSMVFSLLFCLLLLIIISSIPMSSNLTALDIILMTKKCVEVCLGWIFAGTMLGVAVLYRKNRVVSKGTSVN